jgi:hypothetical protein
MEAEAEVLLWIARGEARRASGATSLSEPEPSTFSGGRRVQAGED